MKRAITILIFLFSAISRADLVSASPNPLVATDAVVNVIFIGSEWEADATDPVSITRRSVLAALDTAMVGGYFSQLAQYGVHSVTLGQNYLLDDHYLPAANVMLDMADLPMLMPSLKQAILHTAGALPPDGPNQIYLVFYPRSRQASAPLVSPTRHGLVVFTDNGQPVRKTNIGAVLYHQAKRPEFTALQTLVDMLTDPDRSTGWEKSFAVFNESFRVELSQICEDNLGMDAIGEFAGIAVPYYPTNADNSCVVPAPNLPNGSVTIASSALWPVSHPIYAHRRNSDRADYVFSASVSPPNGYTYTAQGFLAFGQPNDACPAGANISLIACATPQGNHYVSRAGNCDAKDHPFETLGYLCAQALPGLVPVYAANDPRTLSSYLTQDPTVIAENGEVAWLGTPAAIGFAEAIGVTYPVIAAGSQAPSIQVNYRYQTANYQDVLFVPQGAPVPAGYRGDGQAFLAYSAPSPSCALGLNLPLVECLASSGKHYLATDNCRGVGQLLYSVGYVCELPSTGTTPLYVALSPSASQLVSDLTTEAFNNPVFNLGLPRPGNNTLGYAPHR